MTEEPSFSGSAWADVSDGAKDFIKMLLIKWVWEGGMWEGRTVTGEDGKLVTMHGNLIYAVSHAASSRLQCRDVLMCHSMIP